MQDLSNFCLAQTFDLDEDPHATLLFGQSSQGGVECGAQLAVGGDVFGVRTPPGLGAVQARVLHRHGGAAAAGAGDLVRRGGSVERLTGRSKPGVELRRSGDRLRVVVSVGLAWPEPVAETARAVRDDVATIVARVSGMTVEAVDVTVTHLEPTDRRMT
ncbi:hypothetical protein JNB_10954 [Janibacter sp. HTCC2649]|nr:hypothetical protein [Janibacter sp. HTCC2649]EAQ00688.1 hypothetical protein JNB_10954 [Janibacter sp. HTCC2649]